MCYIPLVLYFCFLKLLHLLHTLICLYETYRTVILKTCATIEQLINSQPDTNEKKELVKSLFRMCHYYDINVCTS